MSALRNPHTHNAHSAYGDGECIACALHDAFEAGVRAAIAEMRRLMCSDECEADPEMIADRLEAALKEQDDGTL